VSSYKKLSVSYRIENVSPAHIHFSIFANMIPSEQEHQNATRAKLGNAQCLRVEEFSPFATKTQPDLITFISEELKQKFEELNLE
jgi:hypothetical protein